MAAVDRDATGLAAVSDEIAATSPAPGALTTHTCDLTDVTATTAAVNEIRSAHGGIDGLVHLVGGWRGGATFAENLDEDWLLLRSLLVDTLRNTTLAVHDDLAASEAGRVVVITAASVEKPTAGNANYAAAKAAGEAWILALADSFRSLQSGHAESPTAQKAAAVTAVVNYIGTGRTATTPARLLAGAAMRHTRSRVCLYSSPANTRQRSTRARKRAHSMKVPANLRCRNSKSGGGVRA